VVLAALQHHERLDGKGYPQRLPASQIHPFTRICTIADAYDSMTSNRPGRPALTPAQALERMRSMPGKFDPKYIG
jgi:HD-GYP domain-containing protein (c-di-GMP phosphodiesterase class II)